MIFYQRMILKILVISSFLLLSNTVNAFDTDGVENLGRVPLITEWERKHGSDTPFQPLSHELKSLLTKTIDFQTKGKLDLTEKMFHRILEDSDNHPEILVAFGSFLEQCIREQFTAIHYYIYAIHKSSQYNKAISHYLTLLPIVQEYDQQLFDFLDSQVSLLRSIDIEQNNALDIIDEIQNQKRVHHVYHSNAIEGNKLPLDVVEHIITFGGPPEGDFHAIEILEIQGVVEAFDFSTYVALQSYQSLLELKCDDNSFISQLDSHQSLLSIPAAGSDHSKYTEIVSHEANQVDHTSFILEIHRMILGNIMPDAAGVYRRKDVSVAGYIPPHFNEVPLLMENFGEWLYRTEQSQRLHTVERAALAHYQLTWIHPFQDGNGRTARMLMNTIMMANGYPPIMIKLEDRPRYFDALSRAQQSGDTRPFIYFIYEMALRSVAEYIQELQPLFNPSVFEVEDETNQPNIPRLRYPVLPPLL